MSEDQKEPPLFKVVDKRGQPKEEVKKTDPQASSPFNPSSGTPQPNPGTKKKEQKPSKPRSIDFPNFIISLSTSALMHMGMVDGPEGESGEKNLPAAQQEIDLIDMLKEKTEGNLSKEEDQLIDQVLYELRVRFVDASKNPK